MGRRISNFPGDTGIPSGSLLTFVSGSVNYKITLGNFLTALNVTGSIVQTGGGSDVPVLEIDGTVNKIRNIKPGFGIAGQIDASNSVILSTDFSFDESGVPIVEDPSAESPDFRSFTAGTGIVVSGSGGQIQISASAVPASTKTVTVAQKSDLPTPSGGTITLAADTEYLFLDDVSLGTDRLVLGGTTVISAADSSLITLTYTGTGALVTSINHSLSIKNIKLIATSGSYFDLTGAGAGVENFVSRNCAFVSCSSFGSITNWGLSVLAEGFSVGAAGALSFAGTQVRCAINQFSFSNTAGTGVDLGTSTFDVLFVGPNVTFNTVVGSTGLSVAANSANINVGGFGVITENAYRGGGTLTSGLSSGDLRWDISSNQGIPSTLRDTLSYNTAGTTVAITTINTPVLVGGTWVDDNSSQFTVDGAGTVTYIGIDPIHVPITAGVTAHPVSGSNVDYKVCIAINGVAVTESSRAGRASSGDRQSITPIWQHEFQNGDTCSIMLENNSGTTDFTVPHAVLRVN